MNIAVLTFEGFNELDSFVVAALLNRGGLNAWITAPAARVTSQFGVTVDAQRPLAFAREADAVVIGSGSHTRILAADEDILSELRLDPRRQLVASQCSGVLMLAALGLVAPGQTICTDLVTAPAARAAGLQVGGQPFLANGNVATAGGCLSSTNVAAWLLARASGLDAARRAIWNAAPVGEKDAWAERAIATVQPFLSEAAPDFEASTA